MVLLDDRIAEERATAAVLERFNEPGTWDPANPADMADAERVLVALGGDREALARGEPAAHEALLRVAQRTGIVPEVARAELDRLAATGTPEQKARVATLIEALPPERFPDARRFALLDPDAADRLIDRHPMLAGQPAPGRELLRAVLGDLRAAHVSPRKIEEFLREVDGDLRLRSRTAGMPLVAGAGLFGLLSSIGVVTTAWRRRSEGDASIAAAIPTIERQLDLGASFLRAIGSLQYGGTLPGGKAIIDAHDDGGDDSAVAPGQRGDGARAIAPAPLGTTSQQPDGDDPQPEGTPEPFLDAAVEEVVRKAHLDYLAGDENKPLRSQDRQGDGLYDLDDRDVSGQADAFIKARELRLRGRSVRIDRNVQFQEQPGNADWLPDRRETSKTSGYVDIEGQRLRLKSGRGSPGSLIHREELPGMDAVSPTHVEGHVASIMRELGLFEATVRINNAKGPCARCVLNLEKALPQGGALRIEFINNYGELETVIIMAKRR
jgi:hypothetical protein